MGDVYFLPFFTKFNTVLEATSFMMWLTIKYVILFCDLHHPHMELVADQPYLVEVLITHCGGENLSSF